MINLKRVTTSYENSIKTLLITKNVTNKIKEAIFITVTIRTNISKIFNNQIKKKGFDCILKCSILPARQKKILS